MELRSWKPDSDWPTRAGREILKLDESCISNPEIQNCRLDWLNATGWPVQLAISDFGI